MPPFSVFEKHCINICKSIGFDEKEMVNAVEKVKYSATLTDRCTTGLYRLDIGDGFFWMIDRTKLKTFLCSPNNEPAVIAVDCQLYQKSDEDAICIDRSHYNCERDGSNESFNIVENTDDDMKRLIGTYYKQSFCLGEC
jgi:hypothetical protein